LVFKANGAGFRSLNRRLTNPVQRTKERDRVKQRF
jgi:hypothetical protein